MPARTPASPIRRTSRRGSYAVEFALIFPVWFAIVAAMMDISWLLFQRVSLDTATTRGCRAASLVDPGLDEAHFVDVETRALETMAETLSDLGIDDCSTCAVEVTVLGDAPERSLVCRASRTVRPLTPLIFPAITQKATQVARMEWQRGR